MIFKVMTNSIAKIPEEKRELFCIKVNEWNKKYRFVRFELDKDGE